MGLAAEADRKGLCMFLAGLWLPVHAWRALLLSAAPLEGFGLGSLLGQGGCPLLLPTALCWGGQKEGGRYTASGLPKHGCRPLWRHGVASSALVSTVEPPDGS